MTTNEAISMVCLELGKAKKKFPLFPVDPIHAAAIVAEESGELTQAALKFTYENDGWNDSPEKAIDHMITEAVQTAATAVRFLENAPNYAAKPEQV